MIQIKMKPGQFADEKSDKPMYVKNGIETGWSTCFKFVCNLSCIYANLLKHVQTEKGNRFNWCKWNPQQALVLMNKNGTVHVLSDMGCHECIGSFACSIYDNPTFHHFFYKNFMKRAKKKGLMTSCWSTSIDGCRDSARNTGWVEQQILGENGVSVSSLYLIDHEYISSILSWFIYIMFLRFM